MSAPPRTPRKFHIHPVSPAVRLYVWLWTSDASGLSEFVPAPVSPNQFENRRVRVTIRDELVAGSLSPVALTRSEQMSRIRGSNTKPEVALGEALALAGIRPEPQLRIEGARPDLVLPDHRLVVFVDGCFWHGCPDHYPRPRTRADFWAEKLRKNLVRDRAQTLALEEAGWKVLRVWSHEVHADVDDVVARVQGAMTDAAAPCDGDRVLRVEAVADSEDQERRVIVRLRDLDAVIEERVGRRVTAKGKRPPRS